MMNWNLNDVLILYLVLFLCFCLEIYLSLYLIYDDLLISILNLIDIEIWELAGSNLKIVLLLVLFVLFVLFVLLLDLEQEEEEILFLNLCLRRKMVEMLMKTKLFLLRLEKMEKRNDSKIQQEEWKQKAS